MDIMSTLARFGIGEGLRRVGLTTALVSLLAGCSAAQTRGPLLVAQLTPGADLSAAGKEKDQESPASAVPNQAYALFGRGVMLRLQSDHARLVLSGRVPADENEAKLSSQELLAQSDALWKEATDCFTEVLKLDPKSADAARQLGDGYLERGKGQEALKYLKLAGDLDPEDFILQYRLGALMERGGSIDQAIGHFQLAVKARSGDFKQRIMPVLLLKLAALLERAGKLDDAEATYRQFLDLPRGPDSLYEGNPALVRLVDNKAAIYRELGKLALKRAKPDEAVASLKKALELEPGFHATSLMLAQAYVAAGDKDAAIKSVEAFIEAEPDNSEGYRYLVGLYEQLNRLPEAIDTTEKLLARQPDQFRMRFLLGGMYERTKQLDQAVACYRQIVTERRVYLPAYLRLAEIYHDRKEDAEALWVYSEGMMAGVTDESLYGALDKLIEDAPDAKALAETMRAVLPEGERSFAFYYVLGLVHQSADQVQESADAYEQAVKLNPRFIYGYIRLAALYVDQKRIDDAVQLFKKAQDNQVRSVLVYRFLGELLITQQQYEEAAKALEKALELEPGHFETTVELAQVYRELKKPKQAEDLLLKGMQTNAADTIRWSFALGLHYLSDPEGDNVQKGIDLLQTCAEAAPDDPRYVRSLALAYVRLRDYEKALQYGRRLMDLEPKESSSRYLVAGLYEESGDLVSAENTLRVALGTFPKEPQSFMELGRFLIRHRRNTTEGILLLERAVMMQPKEAEPLVSLGWANERLKKYDKALEALGKARELEPDNRHVAYTLAAVYQSMKRYDDAEAELRKLLDRNADDPIANNALGYFYAEASRKLDEAAVMVKKALETDPRNGAYLDSLGWVYYKQGKLEEARQLLEEALSQENDGVISEHLGDVLYRLGKSKEAETAWQRAGQLDPYLDSSKDRLERLKKGEDPLKEPQQ